MRASTPVISLLPLLVVLGASTAAENTVTDSALQVRGIFNAALPGTEPKNSLHLLFKPHFGDLINKDHLRVPFGMRYGLTENWEATAELEAYISHGIGDTSFFAQKGFSSFNLGTKYRLGNRIQPNWDSAVGLDLTRPLGRPPVEVTDGLQHVAPFVTFARPLAGYEDVRVFWGLGADFVNETTAVGRLEKNQLGDDTATLTTGLVWEHGSYHYTLEVNWTTTDWLGGPLKGNVLSLRPGIVWRIPKKYTFDSRGQWLLGLGLRLTNGPDGTDVGAGLKLRVNFDFKKLRQRFSFSANP
ncbi:MAG: hypothetical protein Q8M02_10290 [Candidatus Didemnitutus sp.]|nr:hypothetical protein [Candidatus Didemnitutus sp.]